MVFLNAPPRIVFSTGTWFAKLPVPPVQQRLANHGLGKIPGAGQHARKTSGC